MAYQILTYSKWRSAKHHIQAIRSEKFSIGKKEKNPLNQDLHHAVTSLSAELYTKDVHFLMELIQNAEDNEYPDGVEPTLEFILTERDITKRGAPATLLVFNNEVGFSSNNIDAICSVGRSTKRGNRRLGFIGEKGIGFKSVFLVSSWPYIFSKGYRVGFSEKPDEDCGIGYIVPKWADRYPCLSDVHDVYGSTKAFPTTIIILPLKPDKVEAVKAQLSELHPEILLFLSKIKRLYVRDPKEPDDAMTVSISSETEHVTLRDKKADARVVQLAIKENMCDSEKTCKYYIWRQAFPVTSESRVSARMDVEEWILSLAFPCGERLTRGTSYIGVYAFLPTAMVTNFPFAIQADFLLASSRENILLDSRWNLGILECVPTAFSNAFETIVKEASSLFSVPRAYEFIPTQDSPFPELNEVRGSIKAKLQGLHVVLCEEFYGKNMFRTPSGVIRIPPEFRKILNQIKSEGVSLDGLFSLQQYVLDSSLDLNEYDAILEFFGLASSDYSFSWCEECIEYCNLAFLSHGRVYIELLCFIAKRKVDCFRHLSVLKYVNREGKVELCSLSKARKYNIQYSMKPDVHAWLKKCNSEFGCPNNMYFLPSSVQKALPHHYTFSFLQNWLARDAGLKSCSAFTYGDSLARFISEKRDPKLAVKLAQFLYHTHEKRFINDMEAYQICQNIPVMDGSAHLRTAHLRTRRYVTLVPASGSQWAKLLGTSNPFVGHGYIDLGDVYRQSCQFAGKCTPENEPLHFLCKYCRAVDMDELCPPNVVLQVASSELTSQQAFLLLEWIRSGRLKHFYSPQFVNSVRVGKWLKTLSGFNSPNQSILPNATSKVIYDMMSTFLKDFAIVDQEFYTNKIGLYEDELKFLGVSFGLDDVHKLVFDRSKSYASSGMSKECVFSLLMFLGYLKASNMLDEEWLKVVKEGKWLMTCQGYSAPVDSILLPSEMDFEAVSSIASLPVVDESFYGSKIVSFSSELTLLGVVSDREEVPKLIAGNMLLKLSSMNKNSGLLILNCIRSLGSSSNALIEKVKNHPWLKTCSGTKCPVECVLPDPAWSCLSNVIEDCCIDENFYDNQIRCYKAELVAIGVTVEFDGAVKIVSSWLKSLATASRLTPNVVFSLLKSVRQLNATLPSCACELCHNLSTEEWLKTRHGHRTPSQSILFNSKWGTISLCVDLPLIDDSFYGLGIYGFKDELKLMSVVTDFDGGAIYVARGLNLPIELSLMTVESTFSLLECIKVIMSTSHDQSLLDNFVGNLKRSRWLKTADGYKMPDECILWDEDWDDDLLPTDGPTIDQRFYGTGISLYKNELRVLGVKMDSGDVCFALFRLLLKLTETSVIKRIYGFLWKFRWKPEAKEACNYQVWIPDDAGGGKWVNSEQCVLRDRYNLFVTRFYALDKYYRGELLSIFSSAFGVAEFPSLDSYLQLWHSWLLRSNHQVTLPECSAFWCYVTTNWNSHTQEILRHSLMHVPATKSSGEEIFLVRKEEIFIPDDLQMAEAFSGLPGVEGPLFAWLPKRNAPLYVSSKLLSEIYSFVGVKKISHSVKCSTSSVSLNYDRKFGQRNELIGKGLVKLILCFLGNPENRLPKDKRQKAAKSILDLSVYETEYPIQVKYSLFNGKMPLEVEKTQMILWLKAQKHLLIYKSGYDSRKKNMEFAFSFSREIAEGLIASQRSHLIDSLSNMVQMAFMFDFNEDAVDFLLRKANLELCNEDEEFLSAEFSPAIDCAVPLSIIPLSVLLPAPTTPQPSRKKQRKE